MKEIKLFDYQEDMKERIEKALHLHRSVMAQMPTGTGKTYLLTAVIDSFVSNNPMEKVWIVAHRRELVSQIDETVRKFHSYSASNTSTLLSSVKAMSIQWLMRHYDEIEEEPGMIVIDEAHHALAKTYKEMWSRFPKAKFLGLTATPCRLNGKGFTDLFDVLVQSWDVPEFISKGRLATYDFVSIKSDGVTQRLIDSLQKRGADGDYQNKEMDMLLNKKPSIERLYRSLEEYGKDRKGIVYAINISHAQKITKLYQENGVKAIAIDSKTPAAERQQDIEAFKKGDIQVLVNVDIFSEGFDCPDVEFVQLARPTLSLAKYLQMVGRGLRVAKGKKNCVIIDNVGLYRVFGLPSQVWNWNAMFEGKLKVGKRKETPKERDFFLMYGKQETMPVGQDSEMMMVMSHEELMQSLKYREFVDCNDDFAIVKLNDGKMTVVNRQGEQVIEPGNYYDMKFLQGNILSYRPRRKTVCYYDLLARVVIDEDIHAKDAPEVITINKWEFVEYNGLFKSRTYEYFALPFRPSQYDLWNYGYYLIYNFQRSTTSGCQEWIYKEEDGGSIRMYKENSEKVCFLRGDHTHVYWLCADLYDSGIVVMDSHEDYYFVDSSLKKTYIGCNQPKTESEKLMVAMPRLGKLIYEREMQRRKKQEEQELLLMQEKSEAGHVELYQAGKKWGVKVDGKVIVPPLYHSIAQPVGAYCAFEQIPRHWGVMTLKGKVIVDAKYEKVEIRDNGIAVVTGITGKTQTIKLLKVKE
jgi:superfamily II DNA or RNA helicase